MNWKIWEIDEIRIFPLNTFLYKVSGSKLFTLAFSLFPLTFKNKLL